MIFALSFLSSPTYNLPHAANMDSHIQLGSGAAFLRAGPLPSARLAGAYSQGAFAVNASYTGYFGQDLESFSVLGFRYQLIKKETFQLAPTVMLADHHGISAYDARTTGRLGLALSGGKTWIWDVSLSLVGVQWFPVRPSEFQLMSPLDCMLASEFGVSRTIGAHQIRLGLLGPMPSISYKVGIGKGQLRVTGATLGDQNILQVELGTKL